LIGGFFQWLWPENHYSILENNCLQSTAGAPRSMTSRGLVNAVPPPMMLSATSLPAGLGTPRLWPIPRALVIRALGVFLAGATQRQMINVEGLRFPTGTAAAATLRALHEKGGEAARQARALTLAALLGAVVTWFRDAGDLAFMKVQEIAGAPKWAPI